MLNALINYLNLRNNNEFMSSYEFSDIKQLIFSNNKDNLLLEKMTINYINPLMEYFINNNIVLDKLINKAETSIKYNLIKSRPNYNIYTCLYEIFYLENHILKELIKNTKKMVLYKYRSTIIFVIKLIISQEKIKI